MFQAQRRDRQDRQARYLESIHFRNFVRGLLPVDYAVLIQRDPLGVSRNRYHLSHYHVRIDWPISEAAEDLAQRLKSKEKLNPKVKKMAEKTKPSKPATNTTARRPAR